MSDIMQSRAKSIRVRIEGILCAIALLVGIGFMLFPPVSSAMTDAQWADERVVATVEHDGREIPVVESYDADRAPDGNVAGLWLDSTYYPNLDFRYIIGHNPGVFTFVEGMEEGDEAKVDGVPYVAKEAFVVDAGTRFDEIGPHVMGIDRCVILQCCTNGEEQYRVVVMAPADAS